MIKVIAKFKLKQDVNMEEYLTLSKEVIDETRKEKGCITYILHQAINDPSVLTMIEEWEDEEAIKQHDNSEHMLRIVPVLRKMRESTEINRYKELM